MKVTTHVHLVLVLRLRMMELCLHSTYIFMAVCLIKPRVCHPVQTISGVHPTPCSMGTWGSFPGGEVVRAWSWPVTSSCGWGQENVGLYITPPHAFMAQCSVKYATLDDKLLINNLSVLRSSCYIVSKFQKWKLSFNEVTCFRGILHGGSGPIKGHLHPSLAIDRQFHYPWDWAPIVIELCYVQPVSRSIDGSPKPILTWSGCCQVF
jgi:hypothetical protein